MITKEKILKYIKKNGPSSGKEIADAMNVSRQAVHKHIKKLRKKDKLIKIGRTKSAKYHIKGNKNTTKKFSRRYVLHQIEEDKVFREFNLSLGLKKRLSENSFSVFNYAFTEILNNAMDHSKSEKCDIDVFLDEYNATFSIRDYGIGIFYSIFDNLDLKDEYEAVTELMQGKTTTMEKYHSGEGIFFTSKLADRMSIRSHKIKICIDNKKDDIYYEKEKKIKGTLVEFTISKQTRKSLENIFNKFAPEEFDFRFEKTHVYVKMLRANLLSRAEAKRLLSRLDKFSEITLDYRGVKKIGQSFADEIYRVFQNKYPNIKIESVNANPLIESMIEHVG